MQRVLQLSSINPRHPAKPCQVRAGSRGPARSVCTLPPSGVTRQGSEESSTPLHCKVHAPHLPRASLTPSTGVWLHCPWSGPQALVLPQQGAFQAPGQTCCKGSRVAWLGGAGRSCRSQRHGRSAQWRMTASKSTWRGQRCEGSARAVPLGRHPGVLIPARVC